ncbi:MAG TPA: trimethylamine methyltransferase family protein [Thermoleophilia bacterium]|nr:trimethylamine methyltransferase family protein [Thermoleophilia bacterium]
MLGIAGLWPDEAIEAIHAASLALLERAGVRVESPAAHEILLAAGCSPAGGDRLVVPRQVVDEAVAALPARYVLTARDPARSLPVDAEPGEVFVHNMGGAADVSDALTGATRRATIADQGDFSRVMHHLVNQHTVCSLLQPQDVPGELEPLYSYAVVAFETDKYVGGPGISFPYQARHLLDMAREVTGADGAGGRYPLDLAFSPVSPLLLGAEVTDALVDAVRRGGVAVEILPCPAAATTAPATLSAAVAQQNAEVLAGLVLVQAVGPGTPTYYGPRLSAVDPRTGIFTSGTPETGVSSIAAVLLARRYGMACDCYGPTTDALVPDAQFGIEHALNALLGMLARPRFLSGVGDVHAGAASTLEALVIDDDVLNDAFYAIAPRPWDDAALDVDAMVEGVLSGKGFLGSKHTRRYIRSEFVSPLLAFRGGAEEWARSGHRGMVDLARERVDELLGREPVGLPADTLAALCERIDVCARELGLTEWPDPRVVLDERARARARVTA